MPLTLEGVSYSYARGSVEPVRALRAVTLGVERGEIVLVVGATGSGKSTLMRVAAGLLEPDEGSVRLDGEPLPPGAAGGRIGLIFQDPESQLFADTLADDVAFGPRNLGFSPDEARSMAVAALDAVGLDAEHFSARSPFSLSGGEARRAAIAGVLAMQPDYLLADEPTAGLDANGRRAVRDLLVEQKARSGVVVVSHAAEQFLDFADRLVVLDGGAVAHVGDASAAIRDPDILVSCGIALPEVLEVGYLARRRGLELGPLSIDPSTAATALVGALGGR
jgi:energy-coupling factor transport system ATP-binding protein